MRWTDFRLLARGREWFDECFDHDGPACYELALGGPRGGDLRLVYVGETANEARRMERYGRDGSHLGDIIAKHLRRGWSLYYRAVAMPTKRGAREMQERLLGRWDYDWNIILNR